MARAGRRFLLRPTRPPYVRLRPVAAGPPINAAGATATWALSASVGTVSMVAGSSLVPGVTAVMAYAANVGAPTLSAGALSVTGITAPVFTEANAGVLIIGSYVPGDLRVAPIDWTGLTGSMTIGFAGYSLDLDDPGTTLATVWFRYVPPGAGTLTVSVPADTRFYILEDGSPDPYDDQVAGPDTYTFPVSGGVTFMWGPTVSATATETISWSFDDDEDADLMSMDLVPAVVEQTPTSVVVFIVGAPASSPISVSVAGYPATTTVVISDSAGIVSGASVAIPALPAGTAIVVADSGSSLASAGLSVLNPPPGRPTDLPADAAPGLSPQVGVVKWVLFDPAPGGTTYTFPMNPTTWSSPHAPKNVLVESTTAGNPIVWQGATRSHQFTFSGYLDDQATYEALEEFRDLNHRHWLVDHRNRAWVVSIDAIDWAPKRVVGKPWAYNYSVRAQIYKGPVTL